MKFKTYSKFVLLLLGLSLAGCFNMNEDNDWGPWQYYNRVVEVKIINDSLFMRHRTIGEISYGKSTIENDKRFRNIINKYEFFGRYGNPVSGLNFDIVNQYIFNAATIVQISSSNLFMNITGSVAIEMKNLDGKHLNESYNIGGRTLQYVDPKIENYYFDDASIDNINYRKTVFKDDRLVLPYWGFSWLYYDTTSLCSYGISKKDSLNIQFKICSDSMGVTPIDTIYGILKYQYYTDYGVIPESNGSLIKPGERDSWYTDSMFVSKKASFWWDTNIRLKKYVFINNDTCNVVGVTDTVKFECYYGRYY